VDPLPVDPERRHRERLFRAFAFLGLAIGLGANVVSSMPLLLWIFTTPRGTPIRPMGWTALVADTAFVALCAGVPFSALGLFQRARYLGLIALVLCFSPWPWAMVLLRLVARIMEWRIED